MPRHFKDVSLLEFSDKLNQLAIKLIERNEFQDEYLDLSLELKIETAFIFNGKNVTAQIYKDLQKIIFDCENVMCDKNYNSHLIEEYGMSDILGLNLLDNGMPFVGVYAGGDWEHPVFFILYWDGSKFRSYIPEDGNTFNKESKTAYGSEEDSKKDFTSTELDAFEDFDEPVIYPDLIIQDIKNRITRKNG